MISKTKYRIDESTIEKLFRNAAIGGVNAISALGAGEYNAVFSVRTNEAEYALKIAPSPDVPILTYEKNIMESEIFWYNQMKTHTKINVPEIYFTDLSKSVIPVDYFIMQKLEGEPLDKIKLSKQEKEEACSQTAKMAAQIHKIKNNRFGYIQNTLYDDWYSSIKSMVQTVLDDCGRMGRRSKNGEKLLVHIDKNKEILKLAPCCMVNFDIWESNIIARRENDSISFSWIDPERSYWGDPIVDFVCLEMMKPLCEKKITLAAYNAQSDEPIKVGKNENIRYAVAQGYLGLIMETEKYFRYTKSNFGWWRNVFASNWLFKSSFKTLKTYS